MINDFKSIRDLFQCPISIKYSFVPDNFFRDHLKCVLFLLLVLVFDDQKPQ